MEISPLKASQCTTCGKSKGLLNCGICECTVCKYCAQIPGEDRFSFMPQIPEKLTHGVYCGVCFDQSVASDLEAYDQTMEKAKDVHIYFKKQGKETRLLKRIEDPFQVLDCPDRDEAILRLAFVAAQKNLNAVLDVDVITKKIRLGSYQTQSFSATGVPAQVDSKKLVRDKSIWDNPN